MSMKRKSKHYEMKNLPMANSCFHVSIIPHIKGVYLKGGSSGRWNSRPHLNTG